MFQNITLPKMTDNLFNFAFAQRLKSAMIKAGMNSQKSTSGIDIIKLSEKIGHSVQICRKYLKGEALPEPSKVVLIAAVLNVSPGWLLFGEKSNSSFRDEIVMRKEIFEYILNKTHILHKCNWNLARINDFIIKIVLDLYPINATLEQQKQIIDIIFSTKDVFDEQSN
jgi:transcriptional regulator with XRE-family HTH domain